jgi:outer membrane protein assembly factor BamB
MELHELPVREISLCAKFSGHSNTFNETETNRKGHTVFTQDHRHARLRVILLVVSWWLTAATQAADNWPQFRGPGASGVSDKGELPNSWSATDRIVWRTPIPGRGWSSPIVWGNRVFVTTAVKEDGELEAVKKGLYFGGNRPAPKVMHRWVVLCLDLDSGKILWERNVHRGVPEHGHHLKNSLASETPISDGERLYAYFGNIGMFCFDIEGKPLWTKRWESVPTRFGWGTAASPVLHGERIYVVNDNDKASFLVALNKKTGDQVWRVERDEKSNWATPFVWDSGKRVEIVTPGTGKIRSYDLDGELLWELRGMSSITIPTPLAAHGLLYITSGYVGDRRKPLFAIRSGAAGDISLEDEETNNEYVVWCQRRAGPYNPSPIVYGDYLYVLYDRGLLACYSAKTGKEVYLKRRIGAGATAFTTSPWAYGGKIFCLSEDGDTFVIQAGPEFKLLGKNSLGELCMATPAIVGDGLIMRTESQLLRIR